MMSFTQQSCAAQRQLQRPGMRPRCYPAVSGIVKRVGPLRAASPIISTPVSAPAQQQGWRVLQPGQTSNLPRPEGRPWSLPFVGDVMEVDQKGAFKFSAERLAEFGPIYSWKLGGDTAYALLDFETVKSLLAQDGKVMVAWNPEGFYAMLGENTRLNMENPARRMAQRKLLAPGFTERATTSYIGEIVDICREMLDSWADAGVVDVATQAKGLSFEFSTRLLVKFRVPDSQKAELRGLFDDVFRALLAPAINLPGTRFWKGIQAKKQLQEKIKTMMLNTPHLMESLERSRAGVSPKGSSAAASNSVFDTMVLARTELSRSEDAEFQLTVDDVAQTGIGLIIAGNDTSGLGITGLLGLLPMFPGIMERVRQEQQQVIAAHGPEFTRAALDSMPYTDAVIKEVLRVLPPARGALRRTLVDMEVNGKFLPAGSILYLDFHLAQLLTDPGLRSSGLLTQEQLAAVEANPPYTTASLTREFNPERWLQADSAAAAAAARDDFLVEQSPSNGNGHSSAAAAPASKCPLGFGQGGSGASWAGVVGYDAKPSGLLTFGSGPHVCLGMGLFNMEAKVLLALLAREYDVNYAQGSANFTYSFFPELRQPTLLNISKRAA